MPPVLEADGLQRRLGAGLTVQGVGLAVGVREVVCLLGPSGCGKSTTLRMIAGIERPDGGRVRLDGREVSGPSVFVPPERRSVGLMFQDFALFPHLDVRANVGFGLPRSAARREERVEALLRRVGLAAHARRLPHELSGGEQQRVALARALAPAPRALLMDEPFSGLDNRLRDGVREATLDLLRESGTAVLLVTHDPEEAMRIADRIVLMRAGRVVQVGAPRDLYDRPADRGAAEFFSDVNILSGRVAGGGVETVLGRFAAASLPEGTAAEVGVRPQHLALSAARDGTPALVERARFVGRESVVDLRAGSLRLRALVPGAFPLGPGAEVRVTVPPGHAFVFAAE